MPSVDLNSDLGEGFGTYRCGDDDAMLAIVTSANVACGLHAGDPEVMARTFAIARERVGQRLVARQVGAHEARQIVEGAADLPALDQLFDRHEPLLESLLVAEPLERDRWEQVPAGEGRREHPERRRIIARDRVLAWAVVGNTYLWFLAALLQFVIVIYGHDVLRVDEAQISYLQAAVGIGIGVGSLTAGYLSRGKIEYRFVPLGAIGMTLFGFLVSRHGLGIWPVRSDLAMLGFFGGFYAVPLNALIQHRPAREQKGGVIAAANLLSFVGVFLAAGMYFLFASVAHLQPDQIFMAGAIMTLGATLYTVLLLPDSKAGT